MLHNVNGFTHERSEEIRSYLNDHGQEGWVIVLLTEINVDWRESFESFKVMTRWAQHRHVHFAHNTFDSKKGLYQPGGVAIVSLGQAAAKVLSTEMDSSGLGRWCSVQYQLKASKVWVMVVYRPCVSFGPDTVYQQHIRRLNLDEERLPPREALLRDLEATIARYKEDGSFVILGGDFNEDIRQLRIQGVREVTSRFANGPTYQRGSDPIDGFFTSHTLPVTGGGIFPFYSVCSSDHTAVWMTTSVFGTGKKASLRIRRLQLSNKNGVRNYLGSMRAHAFGTLNDKEAIDLMVRSEHKCCRVRTGGLDSSPELTVALTTVRLWRLRLKRKLGNKVNVSLLRRLERKCGLEDGHEVLNMDVPSLQEGLAKARKVRQEVGRNHQSLRISHLLKLAVSRPEFEAMMEREKVRAVFKRLKEAIPSKAKRPLFMVQDIDGDWKDTQESIFSAIAEENIRRFTQTKDTPLRQEPLRHILGDLAETEAAEAILDGSFVAPEGVDDYFVALLPFLVRPPGVKDLVLFDAGSFMAGWKKMKEFTGCQGPLHFGHYKALASDGELSSWAASKLYESFYSGTYPSRWLSGTDVMIEKKAGIYAVDQLRTILLFQPDFNFGNKAIGRQMMRQAEELGLIPESQYGSRHGKSAAQQLLNKVCLFELARAQQVPLGYCSTDAKSCYDRIVHSFASLAMRKWGVPKVVAQTMFGVIASMSHRVQTGYGESSEYYSHPSSEPFQGVGQGNGAGPAIWAAVSSPLLDFLDSRGRGIRLHTPLSHEIIQVSSLSFVDDTDVLSGIPEGDSSLDDSIIHSLSEQVADWGGSLRVTGGAIVPIKSFYWILNFIKGKTQARRVGPDISAIDSSGGIGRIPFVPNTESRRTLGMLINPLGTWTAQRDKMRMEMVSWAESSRIANLSRSDAMVELKSRVLPRLLYGLESTSFLERDCRYIMAPALKVGLNLCGTVRTLPHQIVFGPEELLGLGIHDIYLSQGIMHLQALSVYGPMDTCLTGKLIRGLMEQAAVDVGMGSSVLSLSFAKFGSLLSHGWVKTLWRFCSEFDIKVDDWIPTIPLLRERDQYIMQCAQSFFPAKDTSSLVSVNTCRRYLQVVSLADITFGNGRTLIDGILKGDRQRSSLRTEIHFSPSYPSSADWSVWRSFLTKIFPLRTELGRWSQPHQAKCRLSSLEDAVFIREGLGWSKHRLISGSRSLRSKRYALQGVEIEELPAGTLVSVVEHLSNGLVCWGGCHEASEGVLPSVNESQGWFSEPFGVERHIFLQDIAGCTLTICSDGSFKSDQGTASWIAVVDGKEMGEDLMVPEGPHSAYRSELAGIYGVLRFVDSLGSLSRPAAVRVVCDGLSALQSSFGTYPLNSGQSNLDLLQFIRRAKASILAKGIRLIPVHVYGHADDSEVATALTFDETLNVAMDARAKAFWQKMAQAGWPKVSLQGSCVVRWNKRAVEVNELGASILGSALKRFWINRKAIPATTELDWSVFSKATRLVRRAKGVFLTKFFSGICGVNLWRRRWGLATSDLCSRCELEPETTCHLWDCPNAEASSLRQRHLDELMQWISDKGGNSRFCSTIRSVLSTFRNNSSVPLSSIPAEYREAVAEQQIIGWDNFLLGLWVIQWRHQLMRERDWNKSIFKLPERAIAEIISKLWEIGWHLWLGRNAAIYPSDHTTPEGETVARSFPNFGLCRKVRRQRKEGNERSKQCMRNWLNNHQAS